MQLSQFQNVQTLELASYKFSSFLAIRRFVGALPRLSTVILTDISWGEDVPRTTSLIHSNWALRIVKLWGCQSPFLGHWFWIIPPPKTSKRSYRELERPGSHPGISAMDAQAISDIIQILANGNGEGNSDSRELRWEDTTSTKLPACKTSLFISYHLVHLFIQGYLNSRVQTTKVHLPSPFVLTR